MGLDKRPIAVLWLIDAAIAFAVLALVGTYIEYELADAASSIKALFIFDFCLMGMVAAKKLKQKERFRAYSLFAVIFAIYPLFETGNLHILLDIKIHELFGWDRGVEAPTRRLNDFISLTFFLAVIFFGWKFLKNIPGYKKNISLIKAGLAIFIFSVILDFLTTRPSIFEIFIKNEELSFTLGTMTSIFEELVEVFCLNYFLVFFYYSTKKPEKN